MKLYLMRHGTALSPQPGAERQLTARGRAEVAASAEFLARHAPGIRRIFHSGISRAEETARIVGDRLGVDVERQPNLTESDPAELTAPLIDSLEGDALIVGHFSHIPRLASWLLLRGEERVFFTTYCASIICLERDDDGGWSLDYFVSPAITRD